MQFLKRILETVTGSIRHKETIVSTTHFRQEIDRLCHEKKYKEAMMMVKEIERSFPFFSAKVAVSYRVEIGEKWLKEDDRAGDENRVRLK